MIFLISIDCGGCNLKFVHPLYYRLHCNVFHDPHYSLTIRKYHCKICGLAVLGKENIVKHAYKNEETEDKMEIKISVSNGYLEIGFFYKG